jgi:malate dehydrogenase (oxaloacetate-decarboxylating)
MSPRNTPALRLIEDPIRNHSTAYSEQDRSRLGLRGLLPYAVETLDQQAERAYTAYRDQPNDLAKHVNLRALQDNNETLFYRLLREHVEEILPIVYTPTVGEACQHFSKIYRRPRGLFLAYPDREHLREILRNRPHRDVDVIVVTDGQRILGIGDQGIGGMGIPIGKLSLYTALGGIDPARTLPIVLDVGTDNPQLPADPVYLGWRHPRIDGDDYHAFIDQFVAAVEAELPGTLLQWEDFATPHALPILERYRDRLLTFNDDIQGTAAVAMAALTAGCRISGVPLEEQRVIMLGAGSAGVGVCEQIVRAMITGGLSEEAARGNIYVVDVRGLLTTDRTDLDEAQRRLAHAPGDVPATKGELPTLADVVAAVHPTALLGLSTAAGAFTEPIVRAMAEQNRRPIIMPLSNPTSRSEAAPQSLLDWTDGRALIATGSPFPTARYDGREVPIAQCNNVYVFPGIGLAVTAVHATRVTDAMMTAAAKAVAESVDTHADVPALLPERARLAETATAVARAAARAAVADGVAPKLSDEQIDRAVDATRWEAVYREEEPQS